MRLSHTRKGTCFIFFFHRRHVNVRGATKKIDAGSWEVQGSNKEEVDFPLRTGKNVSDKRDVFRQKRMHVYA